MSHCVAALIFICIFVGLSVLNTVLLTLLLFFWQVAFGFSSIDFCDVSAKRTRIFSVNMCFPSVKPLIENGIFVETKARS